MRPRGYLHSRLAPAAGVCTRPETNGPDRRRHESVPEQRSVATPRHPRQGRPPARLVKEGVQPAVLSAVE